MNFSNHQSLIMSTPQRTIVDLPNELLQLILDLSRPDSFESAALACKTFYHAAGDLINEHNVCRRRLRRIHDQQQENPVGCYVMVKDGFQFMEELFDLPLKLIHQQLRYFTHIVLMFPPYSRPQSPHESTQIKLANFPGLALSLREMGRDYWLPARINDSDEIDRSRLLNRSNHPTIPPPWPVQYRSSFLQLLPNLQSLILDGEFPYEPDDLAQDFAPLIEGRVLFQQLEEVFCTNARGNTYEAMSPLFALPRLKTLMADEFDQPFFFSPNHRELNDGTSSIELIALFRASLRPFHMEKLLQRCPCLHTFLWEDYTDAPTYDSIYELDTWEDFDGAPYEDGLEAGIKNHIGPMIPFDHELDAECTIGEPPEWKFHEEDTEPPFLFKPNILLKFLERTHADKLRHLAFTINRDSGSFPCVTIRRSFKVLHFLAFRNLTHLEFDVRVLRLRKGSHTAYPSLANVLPRSLQALRLILPCLPSKGSQILGELLEPLPGARKDFPFLKDIFVMCRVIIHYTLDLLTDEQMEIRLRSLRTCFHQVDVTFGWELIRASHNSRPKVDWIQSSTIIGQMEVMDKWV
ncbi:hypothetical protein EJ08DRAFT_528454 [Tothia fuscella]|uniref:F-box domain-containing protein n=1 Tax=Tothia fuscella TaxID=1048955 RepID=A0A9P4NGN4_9PEZI|nr:hypothetical protein EJ08DRAFT_528454 [Tothia fuscella]